MANHWMRRELMATAVLACGISTTYAKECPTFPVALKFSSGERLKIIERKPHLLTYEITKPDGSLGSRSQVHDFFTVWSARRPEGS